MEPFLGIVSILSPEPLSITMSRQTNSPVLIMEPLPPTFSLSTTHACSLAHGYPNGAECISSAGQLTLVTPTPVLEASVSTSVSVSGSAPISFACHPAHSHPNGTTCVSTSGELISVALSSFLTVETAIALSRSVSIQILLHVQILICQLQVTHRGHQSLRTIPSSPEIEVR